ncbi:hypothetical protein RB595_008339 [Gaeumannomyces hyphopodioides]
MIITAESLLRSLSGVSTAARTAEADTQPLSLWITEQARSGGDPGGFDLAEWASRLSEAQITGSNHSRNAEATDYVALARIAVVAAFLRETSRRGRAATTDELDLCWRLAHASMTTAALGRGASLAVARGAQGVEPIAPDDAGRATHATYSLARDDDKGARISYKTHQAYYFIKNTGALFRATKTQSASHSRNTTYAIPAGAFHRSEVAPLAFHATFFFLDSQCGFVKSAGVLGPKDEESLKALRDPAGVTPAQLAAQVEASREWEVLMDRGRQHAQRTEWEEALKAYNSALQLCSEPGSQIPTPGQRRQLVERELGSTNRRFRRYSTAVGILKPLVAGMEPSAHRVGLSGELGICYWRMNQLGEAARVFRDQLDSARDLGLDLEVWRVLGNLGTVNYQLSLEAPKDYKNPLLDLAIYQLEESVAVARRLQMAATPSHQKLTRRGRKGHMSRFFLGRALLLQGRHNEALALFNEPRTCSLAAAFAKEPSAEHREYLRELIAAGADMWIVDEQGYTAPGPRPFNGDAENRNSCCSWACRRG